MKNKIVMLALTSLSLAYSLNTYAEDYNFNGLSLSTSLGVMSGTAHEYVYNPGTETIISKLDWRINNAAIINGEVNYDFLAWLSANVKGWITLAENKAPMDDYDWTNPYQQSWTHWSHHENTHLSDANAIDLSLRAWLLQDQNYKVGLAAGYSRSSFSWLSKGGCYQYENGTYVGCVPSNEVGIGYQQKFNTPYLGVVGKYLINKFEFNALLKYSNLVFANDEDVHFRRHLTFRERGTNSNYFAATINSGYFLTPNAKIFAEASYNQYFNARAGTQIIDNDSREQVFIPNSAGLSNKNYALSLGLQYVF